MTLPADQLRSRTPESLMKILPMAVCLFLSCVGIARAASLEEAQLSAEDILKDGGLHAGIATAAGTPVAEPTPLQKHVSFFDKNGNGIITLSETELGLRRLGLGRIKAGAAAVAIHLFLGPRTTGSWRSLDISVKDIELGKHGSDTGVFDAEGRFAPEAFERIFARFDVSRSGSMSGAELEAMIAANSRLRPGDRTVASQEFQLLMIIAADTVEEAGGDEVRAISKERLKEFYDGTLFYKLAKPVP